MSYVKLTSFAVKDTLADNNPLKVVRGKEFDDEFNAIAIASAATDTALSSFAPAPVGSIAMFAAVTAPTGWLVCDGTAKSRNTFAALFTLIGTTYGVGDGVNTFNVPNLTSRFPYGGTPGVIGGSADASLPAHTHNATVNINDPGHAHSQAYSPGAGRFLQASGDVQDGGVTGSSYTGITASATVASTGISAVGANLPPFLGLSFIIKT